MDLARAAYVSHYLEGTDALLIAADHEQCGELSRRVRDDLVHLGLVDGAREVELSSGAQAGAGTSSSAVATTTNCRPARKTGRSRTATSCGSSPWG
jgi:hypothetical protein